MRTVLCCVATIGLASVALAQPNLLENGGFEEVSGPTGFELPDGWILDASAESATAPARSGERSLALNPVSSLQGIAAQSDPFLGGTFIEADPGDLFRFSVYGQTLSSDTINGTGHRAEMELFTFNAAGQVTGIRILTLLDGSLDAPANPEDEWILGELELTAPEGTVGVGVALTLLVDPGATGQGTVYWDDASLVLVPAPGAGALLGLGALAMRRRR